MSNRTIIIVAVILTALALPALYYFQKNAEARMGSYLIGGTQVPLTGYQVQTSTNAPTTAVASFAVVEDGFGFSDFPYAEACNAVLAAPPDIPFLRDAEIKQLVVALVEQKRVAVIISSTQSSIKQFDVSDGTCVEDSM